MLHGEQVRVDRDRIFFGKGPVSWQIASPVDAFVQHLVSGVFAEGQEIEIGPESQEARFLIERVETLPRPVFNGSMHFTCLSPITASKVSFSPTLEKGGEGGFDGLLDNIGAHCHYIRPWEEGLSDAIKNNLLKKYRLLHGKDSGDTDFKIIIDEDYMTRKNGKITKNINFKGTNIIGFMAPFEVTGSPELIEVGYEAGFGEKGSMGFGMVKEIV
jgi:CRISPR-associated endoribonuclease Cas6